ncbi:hypothetical protein E2562_036940 [Oryza meyeriana var. granulata]|uniref:Uncharacterized protein n=1 Tax=Oryza meyeriana var. granulata TaxID=110450 RepID=A0A6G1CC85_9ORYZ|nr:hypothetical protein E2562_036940 [Oryza meyeriana var. granulata]
MEKENGERTDRDLSRGGGMAVRCRGGTKQGWFAPCLCAALFAPGPRWAGTAFSFSQVSTGLAWARDHAWPQRWRSRARRWLGRAELPWDAGEFMAKACPLGARQWVRPPFIGAVRLAGQGEGGMAMAEPGRVGGES